jgi:hypothetical protein
MTTEELLADELMEGALDRFDLEAVVTLDTALEAERWLSVRISALQAQREDEIAYPPARRDEAWLAASKATMKRANTLLHDVRAKGRQLRRVDARQRDTTAERAFVQVVRDKVERVEWLGIWDEVYRRHPELKAAA